MGWLSLQYNYFPVFNFLVLRLLVYFGFSVTESKRGLSCEWCFSPTDSISKHLLACQRCNFSVKQFYFNGKKFEDPMLCSNCNPLELSFQHALMIHLVKSTIINSPSFLSIDLNNPISFLPLDEYLYNLLPSTNIY